MFRFQLPWSRKTNTPLSPNEIPRSFTVSGTNNNHLYQVSMDDTYADFVDVDYKRLSYAEAAALSKNRKQTSRVSATGAKAKSSENGNGNAEKTDFVLVNAKAKARDHKSLPETSEAYDDDDTILEKVKTNNYYSKNKVYKQADRASKRKTLVAA